MCSRSNELEGPLGVEVVHHDELPAGGEVGDHDRVAAGGVEQRHGEEEGGLRLLPGGRHAGAVAGGAAGVDEEEAHEVRAHVAVRADGALGPPRGARRVEDRGVVLGVDRELRRGGVAVDVAQRQGEGPLGRAGLALGRLAHRQGPGGLAAVLVGHDHGAEVGQAAEDRADPLHALAVDEGHLGAGVLEPVAQLLAAPPRVQRDDDGPGQGGAPERHHPLRDVAHDDGDAVALLHAELVAQAVGQGAGDPVVLGEGRPLVLVDEEHGVPVPERHVHDGPQGRRRMLPDPGLDATDVELLHLEELPGGGQLRVGLGQGHGRCVAYASSSGSGAVGAARSKTAPR